MIKHKYYDTEAMRRDMSAVMKKEMDKLKAPDWQRTMTAAQLELSVAMAEASNAKVPNFEKIDYISRVLASLITNITDRDEKLLQAVMMEIGARTILYGRQLCKSDTPAAYVAEPQEAN